MQRCQKTAGPPRRHELARGLDQALAGDLPHHQSGTTRCGHERQCANAVLCAALIKSNKKEKRDQEMNALVKPIPSPLAVSDPKIRKELQLAGLRFAISRAAWFIDEAKLLGKALKDGKLSSDQVDTKLEEMGALDLVYPELMVSR